MINASKLHALLRAAVGLGCLSVATAAHADVLFQENFDAGLGQFTSGGTVTTGTFGARMAGCYGCTDGSIRSNAISTVGFTGITLTFTRSTSGLDSGEAGIAEYSTNGSTFTVLESVRTASGSHTVTLPATAAGQSSLTLRFRINASLSSENYTVDSIRLEGTPDGGGCEPNCEPPPPPPPVTDPGTGPWTLVSSTNLATECKLDAALMRSANSSIGTAYAVVRYGKLCWEYYPGGSDPADSVYSTTKTLGSMTIGALIHQSKSIPASTTRKRGPLGEFQRVDHWLDSFTFHDDATIAHVLGMVSDASTSLTYPNRNWQYDTVGSDAINRLSDVVNTVVAQDTTRLGSNIETFWRRHLSTPLGLQNSTWSSNSSTKNFATGWTTTIRDMARLGLVMLNGGRWNGQRLIDEAFLYNAIHPSFEDAHTGYGYLTWLNEDDSCAPKPVHRTYPHGPVSGAPNCLRGDGCPNTYDVGVFYAAGLGGQYIVGHRGLDMVIIVKDSGGQSGSEPMRFWNAIRPAVLAHDPTYRGNNTGFCTAYGRNNYAPDLKLWEGGR